MKKERIIKLLILVFIAGLGTEVFADVRRDLILNTRIPAATSVKKNLRSTPSITVDPANGVISGDFSASFTVNTNDADSAKFYITSSIETSSGTHSAYDNYGNVLFSNISNLPSEADVSQVLSRTGANKNVIAYPVTITATSPLTHKFQANDATYGNCYIISADEEAEGTITHTVGPTPVDGTFSTTRDTAGTYRVTLTITAVGN